MDRILAISVIVLTAVLGFVRIFRKVKDINSRTQFANEFMEQLSKYLNSNGEDYDTYSWLVHRSPKIQREMGVFGLLRNYRPPFSNLMFNNYDIILNILPELRNEFEEERLMRNTRTLRNYVALLNESILRYMGDLSDRLEPLRKELKNPVIWLREGFSWVVLLPLTVLSWVGVLGETLLEKISRNPFFKLFAGIITLLGVVSSIMTIVIGWDSFLEAARRLFSF